ncbi:hypothetical protein GGR52DRAFT_589566 [Hypoxylon sp. FL1284]|nr:hypothetical protein GGR52DRAFT_589566 [Hypoxylon sp. FL1284]
MSHAEHIFQRSNSRLKTISQKLQDDHKLGHRLPGLSKLLDDIVDPETDVPRENSVRRLLRVFWESEEDGTYSSILGRYSRAESKLIRSFVEDEDSADNICKDFDMGMSLGAREELPVVEKSRFKTAVKCVRKAFHRDGKPSVLYNDESRKAEITFHADKEFQNWGRTVKNKPSLTYVPSTSYGIQQIVKYAKSKNLKVRASGYRHSWSPVFGSDGQIMISTLGLYRATKLPNFESLPGSQFFVRGTELNSIDFVGEPRKGQKRLVQVGTAVTNEMFRKWCNEQELDRASTLPLNVIMVEITLGGSNAPICHGAGRRHPTLSDLVHTIEYVDVNGNMQTISKDKDPSFMSVASGCFGLLGIVTHITLELDPMSYAVMVPRKIPVMQAIPPPPELSDDDIPEALRIEMSPQQRAEAQAAFERYAADDFYSEWFWFPYTSKVWVNCWNTSADGAGASEYPSRAGVLLQWAETVAIQILQESEAVLDLQNLFPWTQATLLSKLGLYAMPDVGDGDDPEENAIRTQLPNGLHFRRAIQNVRVRDVELEIPLQPAGGGSLRDAGPDDAVDWTPVQRAWWAAILAAYAHRRTCPQRMPLEMRVTGPSAVTMAPFRGHVLGTCSIEVLTLGSVDDDDWLPYAQHVVDRWMELKDSRGNYLDSRPHWAKEWTGLTVRGRPMLEYVKESYRGAIAEFRETMGRIAESQGWDVEEARQRFSNELFDKIFFE